jgi:hypothetical protein
MQPTPEMLALPHAIARFMATGADEGLKDIFAAEDVVIVENFPPFLITGPDAVARWLVGFRAHAERSGLSELKHRFGEPQDFARDGERAFFVLPTTWHGKAHGQPFTETGGWAFVLDQVEARWRIRSYAWAVTSGQSGG